MQIVIFYSSVVAITLNVEVNPEGLIQDAVELVIVLFGFLLSLALERS